MTNKYLVMTRRFIIAYCILFLFSELCSGQNKENYADRMLSTYGGTSVEYATALYDSGCSYYTDGAYEEALRDFLNAFDISVSMGYVELSEELALSIAETYTGIASGLSEELSIKNYKIALEYIGKANQEDSIVNITQKIINYNLLVAQANKAAEIAHSTSDFKEAIRLTENALELYEQIYGCETIEYANSLYYLGTYYLEEDLFPDAIKCYERELAVIEKLYGENSYDYAACLKDYANVLALNENFSESIRVRKKALDVIELILGKNTVEYATLLGDQAREYGAFNDLETAEDIQNELINIVKTTFGEQSLYYVWALNGLAEIKNHQMDYSVSLSVNIEAMERASEIIDNIDTHNFSLDDWSMISNLYADSFCHTVNSIVFLGILPEAITDMDAWIGINEVLLDEASNILDTHIKSDIIDAIAYWYSYTGDYEKAIMYAKKALELVEAERGKGLTYSLMLNRLSLYYAWDDDFQSAIKANTEAMDIVDSLGKKRLSYSVLYRIYLANCYNTIGNQNELCRYSREIIDLATSQIKNAFSVMTSSERDNMWDVYRSFIESNIHQYVFYNESDSLSSCGYDGLLLSKGLLLNSDMAFSSLIHESGDLEIIKLYDEWRAVCRKVDSLSLSSTQNNINIDSLIDIAEMLELELIEKSKIFGDYTHNLSITWKHVQDRLDENEIAIEFASFQAGPDSTMYVAYVLRKDMELPVVVPLFEENELFEIPIHSWYRTSALYDLIWCPLEKYFNDIETVYFSPSGELYNIAIENVPDSDGAGYVSDYKDYCRLSSTRQLAVRNAPYIVERAVIYGGLRYDSLHINKLSNYLPATKIEAENIGRYLDSAGISTKMYVGPSGTETSFKKLSGDDLGVIHLATHGFYNSEESNAMINSGLLFSTDRSGILTAQEISSLDFKGLDLVVLSACQTGLGEITGEGVFGLQRGFKKAGANSLLMSLWNVDDAATRILMEQFYLNLLDGKEKYESLRLAQTYLREYKVIKKTVAPDNRSPLERKHDAENGVKFIPEEIEYVSYPYSAPRYWAAFILVDGIGPLPIERN